MPPDVQQSRAPSLQLTAVILAAGMGRRLGKGYSDLPKCLLRFGGMSLLRRYIGILKHCGVEGIVVATGYRRETIEDELADVSLGATVEVTYNRHYELGSVVTLWNLREQLGRGDDVLLMDADMLFDYRLVERLLGSRHRDCVLVDRNLEPGDEEPVKLCIRDGTLVELGKQIDTTRDYDFCGEMMGLVGLSAGRAAQLVDRAETCVRRGDTQHDYEALLRDMLLSEPGSIGFEDCTGLPWIEIDFPDDIKRAEQEILPWLRDCDVSADAIERSRQS